MTADSLIFLFLTITRSNQGSDIEYFVQKQIADAAEPLEG